MKGTNILTDGVTNIEPSRCENINDEKYYNDNLTSIV